jgi:hypothetical protein
VQNLLTRQTTEGNPPGGWNPKECITLAQSIEGYTLGAAYAGRREKTEGSLEVGKLADLIVVSQGTRWERRRFWSPSWMARSSMSRPIGRKTHPPEQACKASCKPATKRGSRAVPERLRLVARAEVYGRERWARVAEASVRNRMLANLGGELGEALAKQVRYLQRAREPLA